LRGVARSSARAPDRPRAMSRRPLGALDPRRQSDFGRDGSPRTAARSGPRPHPRKEPRPGSWRLQRAATIAGLRPPARRLAPWLRGRGAWLVRDLAAAAAAAGDRPASGGAELGG